MGSLYFSPLVYFKLIGAVLVGYLAFREIPDTPTILGAGLIIVGGLSCFRARMGRVVEASSWISDKRFQQFDLESNLSVTIRY
jgi:drug/metabolite transporter (DMT)-like permease